MVKIMCLYKNNHQSIVEEITRLTVRITCRRFGQDTTAKNHYFYQMAAVDRAVGCRWSRWWAATGAETHQDVREVTCV